MKTKIIWEAKDIEKGVGALIIGQSESMTDVSKARRATFMIVQDENTRYGLLSIFNGGDWTYLANTAEEFANILNDNVIGYRPLTRDEYNILTSHSYNQLFFDGKTPQ